ncbi:recombinase family protein [Sphingomonas fennica]|uniref:Recombinase family protein n=1 Tax=Edaphosphingomonas fennica TaxID=114404 RepID=A0A2T4I4G9_9SPHN|nr:recombinase family protein [Sphingomonas fennica]PTD24423.1 recombinase family protein [Sphingomonas fennica]
MPDLRRAVIYARYSTDLQTEKSIADQLADCRAFAKREGFKVVGEYHDAAKSGASIMGREGLQDLLAAAYSGQCDAVIVEHQDRLSRDQEDTAHVYKRLKHHGVKLLEVHGGEANTMTVGMKAIVAEMYREDNILKVRRGMKGLIGEGKTAGGRAYGYTPNPANRGAPMIVPEQAEIVRRIFQAYHDGKSPKAICRDLNAEGIDAPRGKLWAPSALYGFAERGTGMLRNPIYKGVIVWNKVRMVKDPDTGKRISRPNPKSEWLSANAPELEIVPPDLFDAVQAQLAARSNPGAPVRQRRPVRLLSGLLKCAACGSGMSVAGVDKSGRPRLRCSAHTNSGTCPNPQTFYLGDVETLVIDTLADELATAEQVNRYAKAWLEGRHKEAAKDIARRTKAETRMKAIGKELERITTMMIKGLGDEQALDTASKELGAERDRLKAELDREPPASNIAIHPTAVAAFAKSLTTSRDYLHSAKAKRELTLHNLHDRGDLHHLVREVVASVTLSRDEDGRMCAEVATWLDHFTVEGRQPAGGCQSGSGGGT